MELISFRGVGVVVQSHVPAEEHEGELKPLCASACELIVVHVQYKKRIGIWWCKCRRNSRSLVHLASLSRNNIGRRSCVRW